MSDGMMCIKRPCARSRYSETESSEIKWTGPPHLAGSLYQVSGTTAPAKLSLLATSFQLTRFHHAARYSDLRFW